MPLLGLPTPYMFGGSKYVSFNHQIADLLRTVRIGHSAGGFNGGSRDLHDDDISISRTEDVGQSPSRRPW